MSELLQLPDGTADELWGLARTHGPVDVETLSDGSVRAQILVFREGTLQGSASGRAQTLRGALAIAIARVDRPNPDIHAREPGTPRTAIFEYFPGGVAGI